MKSVFIKYKCKYAYYAHHIQRRNFRIAKVFSLYIKFPIERWSEIKIAEKDDDEGNKMMSKLGEEFDKTYRQFSATALDLHD